MRSIPHAPFPAAGGDTKRTGGSAVRKLATVAFSFAGALAAAHYLLPAGALLWCAAGLLLAVPAALLLKGGARTRTILLCAAAACGLLWYRGYGLLFSAPAEALAGREETALFRVTDYVSRRDGYSLVYVRPVQEGLPGVRTVLYDYEDLMPELTPGDLVRAEVKFTSAAVRRGEETDIFSSRGVALRAYLKSAPQPAGRWRLAFLYFPKTMTRAVLSTADRVFPDDVAAFMKALLTGDKTALYADYALYGALGTAGVLHVVAVSGMHLSFLYGAVRLLVRSRRRAARVAVPLLWLFALMCGMTPSVVRAALMLTLFLAAPLAQREPDGVTTLGAALLALLLANPMSIGSASLQLSFAAMGGIVTVTPKVYARLTDGKRQRGKKPGDRLRQAFYVSVSSSLGALVFTTPISALRFGYVSLVSPLTNLLVLWTVSACFLGGYAAVLLGLLLPALGTAAGWLTAWAARYILAVCRALASLPFAAVYTSHDWVAWWLIFSYAVFIVALLLRRGRPFRPVVPAALSVMALSAVLAATALYNNAVASVTVLDVGQGQSIAFFDGTATAMVDCGGMNADENAGDTAADFLLSRGRTRVNLLALTHLHEDHTNGVARLLSRVRVDVLLLPESVRDADGQLPAILAEADRRGTQVVYISEDAEAAAGGIRFRLYAPADVGDENERGMIILASVGSWDTLVTGDVPAAAEKKLAVSGTLPDCELYVAGHHGSAGSSSLELLRAARAETVVVSVGYNTYGHPTDEVLWRFSAFDMTVFRTDEDGSVTIRMDANG